ncbi:MAG: hypothetical protein Q7U63_05135 [Polaromonas sp.]|uniref:NACHT domain-containing protein n=1 Tax=Polaromonas sp. TaxID=1869339 RepID=UPI002724D0D5|nr:hypothetical protein [Polaromonas sp.]MDO9113164.1 hypothetical protein [Polaromonas sp.]MDP1887756.1 hypothetical protein [Polaromonas sp.]
MTSALDAARDRLPIERRVRVRQADGVLSVPTPISHFSAVHAWVLIGNPGAGKTDAFKERSAAEGGYYTIARDFVDLERPEDQHPLLFIDGLDEIAAGNAMGFTALGQIRSKLQKLGTPMFRISCREADWRGNTDSDALQRLVGEKSFLELHLEPLNRREVEALVAYWRPSNTQSAADFIEEAKKHDLDALLDNPQTLSMLVKATEGGWPKTKTQTYQMACAKLVQEHNDQWRAVMREAAYPDDELLQAAAYLCAHTLLSGSSGIALQRSGEEKKDVLALPELPARESAPDIALCRAALHTRLFKGTGDGELAPVHRTVAEYLAAQYLAKRINEGLPSKRVLALMLGEDSGVVPELRGLHAWLAATATGNLRTELIERDPLGVILYGDVRSFMRSEKLAVLDALSNEAKTYTYFRTQSWDSQSFGALATADMEEDFRRLLRSADRSPAHLALVDCVLDAMAHGQAMPGLTAELEQLVRDVSYWAGSRTEALRILIAFERAEGQWPLAKKLLQDISTNNVQDPEDELLGTLLSALYPGQIPASELWTYLRQPKSGSLFGSYRRFWHELAEQDTPIEEIVALLDARVSSGYQLSDEEDKMESARIIGALLVRGVTEHGQELDIAHLTRWLSLGLGKHHYGLLEPEHKESLKNWLKDHPAQYRALFEYGLSEIEEDEKSSWRGLWRVQQQLYEAPEPLDADRWYLSLAMRAEHIELRQQLVLEAFRLTERKAGPNAAIALLEKWRIDHPADVPWIDAFLQRPYPPEESDQERIDSRVKRVARTQERERQKLEFFESKLPGFADGKADLGALVEIGNAYLNSSHRSHEKNPEARLREFLNQNQQWVELALHGLRQCLFRADLPTADAIVELNNEGRRYNLATPCLAAMQLHWTESPAAALALPDSVLETAVAFRLIHNYDATPDWFKSLVTTRPAILARVMGPLISAQIAAKKEHAGGLYALAHDADYAQIAKLIVPALLKSFPAKAHQKQLQSLRLLIVSLMTSLDNTVQLEIIADRLANKPGDVAQRVYWYTAGLQLAPGIYLPTAAPYVTQTQARISHLIDLVHEQRERDHARITQPVVALKFLIETLGPRCTPGWPNQSGWVSPAMELGRYVDGLITLLAGNPEDVAKLALADLLLRKDLQAWNDSLRRAMFDQRLTRRNALFQPASVKRVSDTLANLTPANAADLCALTLDHLQQLAHEIRNGNTNDYRQYWAGDTPRLEDECRDQLLSDLKLRLDPLRINAEPEGRYADEKRADIKVSAQGYNIPIEIKRETHKKELWKAIEHQLIAKYTRELASDGYGIYLVFWFGGTQQPVAGDGGTKPKTALELQERLQKTVPLGYQHKITVLVIDCSLRPIGKN